MYTHVNVCVYVYIYVYGSKKRQASNREQTDIKNQQKFTTTDSSPGSAAQAAGQRVVLLFLVLFGRVYMLLFSAHIVLLSIL